MCARRRDRVLVSWHVLGGRAADPHRRDVARRGVAGCRGRRVDGSARDRRSDDADLEDGVQGQGWPGPHDQVRRRRSELRQRRGSLVVTACGDPWCEVRVSSALRAPCARDRWRPPWGLGVRSWISRSPSAGSQPASRSHRTRWWRRVSPGSGNGSPGRWPRRERPTARPPAPHAGREAASRPGCCPPRPGPHRRRRRGGIELMDSFQTRLTGPDGGRSALPVPGRTTRRRHTERGTTRDPPASATTKDRTHVSTELQVTVEPLGLVLKAGTWHVVCAGPKPRRLRLVPVPG